MGLCVPLALLGPCPNRARIASRTARLEGSRPYSIGLSPPTADTIVRPLFCRNGGPGRCSSFLPAGPPIPAASCWPSIGHRRRVPSAALWQAPPVGSWPGFTPGRGGLRCRAGVKPGPVFLNKGRRQCRRRGCAPRSLPLPAPPIIAPRWCCGSAPVGVVPLSWVPCGAVPVGLPCFFWGALRGVGVAPARSGGPGALGRKGPNAPPSLLRGRALPLPSGTTNSPGRQGHGKSFRTLTARQIGGVW